MAWLSNNLANGITLGNLACGCLGILDAVQFRFQEAFLFMLAGALLDVVDGALARALRAQSSIGKDLDSLADAITFGVLPGMMLYGAMHLQVGSWVEYLALAIPLSAAVRLAIFNNATNQKDTFIGLPTPAMAIGIGGLASFATPVSLWVLLGAGLAATLLMHAKLEMPSLKGRFSDPRILLPLLFTGGCGLAGLWLYGLPGLALGTAGYVVAAGAKAVFLPPTPPRSHA